MRSAPHFNDPAHWHDRAEEHRVQAEQMNNIDARAMMLRLADDYERLAIRATVRISDDAPDGQDVS